MKNKLSVLVATLLACVFGAGQVLADSHEGSELEPASPVELFPCTFNEGKGMSDYMAVVEEFNDWADDNGLDDYSAWVLVPYYFGPEQEFDLLWLGGSPNAKSLGAAQDKWIETGGEIAAEFAAVADCDAHSNFSALRFKTPPKRDNPSNIVISFSDCNMADGVTFDDLVPPLRDWAKYREGHGSTAGQWVLFPWYGGGGEEFDFKYVQAWQNLADQGADYDQINEGGWEKVNELFRGMVACDSNRVYLATNLRMAEDDDE